MPNPRHELGQRGEDVTAEWLAARGWLILDRRWRTRAGELDLVCRDPDGALVGIEVKLRRTARTGMALEAVDGRRLRRLRQALVAYAHTSAHGWPAMRLDLVTLEPVDGGWRLRRLAGIDAW